MSDSLLTIGHLARAANVDIETVRYYQRRALLPPSGVMRGAFRYYSAQLVDRIRGRLRKRKIKHAKARHRAQPVI